MGSRYVKRALDVAGLLKERSLFLFGPRQTGKSTYVREELAGLPSLSYNLLDTGLRFRLMADPTLLRQEIMAKKLKDCVVFIDEIQKCPALLDEIHLLIEERKIRFLMTGSSAKKLRSAGINLLGGRAASRHMHPFVYPEVEGESFSLQKVMDRGLLPPHYLSKTAEENLHSYVDTYLIEEIAAEGQARNLPAFARFLQIASIANAKMINYTNVANDAQIPRQTVKLWFQILMDTLLGYELSPFTMTEKRKSIETPKFYFFDLGIVKTLRGLGKISPESADFGEFFEHYLFTELKAWVDYKRPRTKFCYWRSQSGYEVDFILEGNTAVEVKACKIAHDKHLLGLKALREEGIMKRFILVCREDRPRLLDGIEIFPWQYFLELLWSDEIIKKA